MKKSLFIFLFSVLSLGTNAQVNYYKGEWTVVDKKEFFTCIARINAKEGVASGELVWTYWSTDSSSEPMKEMYKGKKGKKAIEFLEGTYEPGSRDLALEGISKQDPDSIIGMDKYTLKISANGQVIFGKTDNNGDGKGMFLALKLNPIAGEKEFKAAKAGVKK